MRVHFLTIAQQELADALAHYDAERIELGTDSRGCPRARTHSIIPASLAQSIKAVTEMSAIAVSVQPDLQVREDMIFILAVAHLSRRPQYWQDREG